MEKREAVRQEEMEELRRTKYETKKKEREKGMRQGEEELVKGDLNDRSAHSAPELY